jgi:hypothetical protein
MHDRWSASGVRCRGLISLAEQTGFPEIPLYAQRDSFHWTQSILWSLLPQSFLTEVSERPLPEFL